MIGKRGLELEESWKIIVALILLALLIFGVILLLKGKGSQVLEAFKNFLRFGGN